MSEIKIKFNKKTFDLEPGVSKLFGEPDVTDAENFEIPTYDCYGDDFDMTFMCQINCAELAPFDDDSMLPDHGMLYFFYNMAEMPATPNILDAASVIYDEAVGELEKLELCDEEGEDISLPELKLDFTHESNDVHALLPEMLELSDDFEYEEDDVFGTDEETDEQRSDDIILLQIDSFETDDITVDFKGGTLCFLINREKLAERDFSDIRVMIV